MDEIALLAAVVGLSTFMSLGLSTLGIMAGVIGGIGLAGFVALNR